VAELQHLTIHGQPAIVAFLRDMGGPLVEAGDATLAIARFEDGTHRYFTVWEPKTLGGSGSGNFGHAGRPGAVGGSGDSGLNLDKNGYDSHGTPGPAIARRGGALWLYRGDGTDINDQLRSGTVTEPNVRDALDQAMRPLGENLVVIRDLDTDHSLPGKTFVDKGYTSTAFARGSIAKGQTIEIEVPARAPVIRVGDYYKQDPEKEIILGRGSQFEVISPTRWKWIGSEIKALGGSGSGNFGHAGRPGEVGGSTSEGEGAAANWVRNVIPAAAKAQVGPVTVLTHKTQKETTDKIDEWLVKHYGYDSAGHAKALTDSSRGLIMSTDDEREIAEQWGHLFRPQIESEDWKTATSHATLPSREKSFSNAFADLVLSKPGQELLDLANPLGFAMNKLADKFGWTRSEH
jgi:hypothetical protein